MSDPNRILNAASMAKHYHAGQMRKHTLTPTPYIEHPARVAAYITLHHDCVPWPEPMVIAAWLHDLLEDTDATFEDINEHFGPIVSGLVGELTRREDVTKEEYIESFRYAGLPTRILKAADRIDNLRDGLHGPEGWRRKYLRSSYQLLECLTANNKELLPVCIRQDLELAIETFEQSLRPICY